MDETLTPNLCLDGASVRRIREEKKLTQLYVAKVVGVTTDTISRWENNRYPSVKRENVLRLAEALEVPLDQILQGREEECPQVVEEPSPPPRRAKWLWWAIGLIFLACAGMWLLWGRDVPEVSISAERLLPRNAAPGSIVPVRVRLQLDGTTKGFILREHFPPGWKLIEASPPASSLDNMDGTARWIVKREDAQHTISYLVRVAPESRIGTSGKFRGEIIANPDGRNVPSTVKGAVEVQVSPYLWADLNGDAVIDDGEMLQASETFDEMKGVHLDWKQLETIWDAGRYQWEEEQGRFNPVRPPAGDPPSDSLGQPPVSS